MTSLVYHRPKTLEEALELLENGVPLAGGTKLTPSLRGIGALVDLQDLELGGIEISAESIQCGGTATLQDLVMNAEHLPEALVRAAKLEAGWNIRNKATIAGTTVTGDGRSPLLTVLLAMGAELEFAPGDERVSLEDVLARGTDRTQGKLITAIHLIKPTHLLYEQVGRSPADRPQVCVAVGSGHSGLMTGIGGFGSHPQVLNATTPQEASDLAREIFAEAGDEWASAEYRSSTAAKLVHRLFSQVQTA